MPPNQLPTEPTYLGASVLRLSLSARHITVPEAAQLTSEVIRQGIF